MRLELERPLVVFDLETTGINPRFDRIVEFAAIKLHPDGSKEELSFRVNPGKPIPAEVTAIHGITDADVADEPLFDARAQEVKEFLAGCDLAGFGIVRFDVPMLEHEMTRAENSLDLAQVHLVDALTIFHRKERRDLSAAVQFYCDHDLDDAHSAIADTSATLDVLLAQLERYPDLPGTVAGLEGFTSNRDENSIDPDGKLKWLGGEAVIGFGQKAGMSLRDMARHEPGYLRWMLNKDFSATVKEIARQALEGTFPKR